MMVSAVLAPCQQDFRTMPKRPTHDENQPLILTDSIAKTLPVGIYRDQHPDAVAGLLFQVTSGGSRSFRLDFRRQSDGRQRRITLGSLAEFQPGPSQRHGRKKAEAVDLARAKAAALRRIIRDGRDPLGEIEGKRAEPSVEELVRQFVAESLPSRAPRTQAEYKDMLDRFIVPAIGRMKVNAVGRADLERLHARITAEGKLRRANAVLTIAHVLFEQAIVWSMCAENPASRIKRNREQHRERYLNQDEIERLNAVLDRWQAKEPDSADMTRLLLLTGARRGEVVGMRWADLDLDGAVWVKPAESTKQRRAHRLPLSLEAVELLRRRQIEREQGRVVALKEDRVFRAPGNVAFRLERHWQQIRAAAGVEDVKLHDLRHSHASLLIAQGISLPIIGAMLGHSEPKTTARYAHLADAPLREAAAIVGKIVGGKSPAK
jgi:integrase